MIKLKLDLDALRVDSFDLVSAHAGHGTVIGREGSEASGKQHSCNVMTCNTCASCPEYSCVKVCVSHGVSCKPCEEDSGVPMCK